MKALIFSDIQFHNWKEFSSILSSGLNSRFQDQLTVLDEVFKAAKLHGCELIIHDGDLFESRAETIDKHVFLIVYEKFVEFSKEGIPIILNVGNHDWIDRTENSHILRPFKEIPNVIVVDSVLTEVIEGVYFAVVPYTKSWFGEIVQGLIPQSYNQSYLFTHQGSSGAKVGPRDLNIKDEWPITDFRFREFTSVFNGHYHKAQKMAPNFYIVGSTLQKDFGERGDWKGYRILDTSNREVTSYEIKTSPRFHKYEIESIEDLMSLKITDIGEKDFVWVHSKYPINDIPVREFFPTKNVRLTMDSLKKELKPRSELNITMDIKTQLELYIKVQKINLDKKKLLEDGIEIWQRSQ